MSTAAGVYLYGNLTGGDNLYQDSSQIKRLVDSLVYWQPVIDNLGDALWASSLVGIIAALVVHMLSWVVLMLDFRSSALQMRRGIYYFEPKKLKFRQSFTFLGAAVSTNMLVFLLWWLLFFLFTFIFAWRFTFDLMCGIIAALWLPIITWLVSYIMNYALTFAVTGYIGRDKTIHKRYWWMTYDLFQYFASCVTGVTSALVRLGIAIGVMLVGFARIDKSLTPTWVDDIMLLDSLAKSYRAAILVHHHHNNPLVHTFIQLLSADAEGRRTSCGSTDSNGWAPLVKRRAANRWRKTVFMLKNPKAAAYKASRPADEEEEEQADGAPEAGRNSKLNKIAPAEATARA